MVNALRRFRSTTYEDQFCTALLGAVRSGDCVWDVGANVGYYTAKLSDLVGETGLVYAFEPAPSCAAKLRELASQNARVIETALGNVEAFLPLTLTEDPLGSTNSLCGGGGIAIQVAVTTGDALISRNVARPPNVVKIDVEGFELEVLEGLEQTLRTYDCRAVFVEVHFGILDRRGHRHTPSRVESLLQTAGFGAHWIDASHIAALRN